VTKEQKANLFDSHSFLRHILDTMPGEVVVRDADSRILFANRAFASTYGKTVDELVGRLDSECWAELGRPPKQIAEWLAEDREVLRTGIGKDYVQEIVRANGEVAYFQNYKERIELPDGTQHLLAQYADITERRRVEAQLAQAEALAAELAGIQKTTATYGHEINNPLTGILGLAQLMLEHDDCPKDFIEMLTEVRAAARRIGEVIAKMQALELPKTREQLGRGQLLDLHGEG